jgi:hypothetical protein
MVCFHSQDASTLEICEKISFPGVIQSAWCRVIRKLAQGFFVREGSLADGAAEQIFFPSHVGLFCATSLNCTLRVIVQSELTMDSMSAGDISLYGVMEYSFYPEYFGSLTTDRTFRRDNAEKE